LNAIEEPAVDETNEEDDRFELTEEGLEEEANELEDLLSGVTERLVREAALTRPVRPMRMRDDDVEEEEERATMR
jgi:hypothetical protein